MVFDEFRSCTYVTVHEQTNQEGNCGFKSETITRTQSYYLSEIPIKHCVTQDTTCSREKICVNGELTVN